MMKKNYNASLDCFSPEIVELYLRAIAVVCHQLVGFFFNLHLKSEEKV